RKTVVAKARPARIIGRVDTDAFVRDGYVAVRGAFGEDTARACRELIWDVLAERGISPEATCRTGCGRRCCAGGPPRPPGGPTTSTCATRSSCTPRPGRTGAPRRG